MAANESGYRDVTAKRSVKWTDSSPNAAGGRVYHCLSFTTSEGFPELRHVAEHAIHAVASIGMRVNLSAHPGCFRPHILAPDLRVSEEKTLLRREAVDLGLRLAVQRLHQGHERQVHAPVVGRIFSQRQFAVQMDVIHRREGGIFFYETIRPLLEFGGILRRPPIVQIAFG